MNTVNEMSRFNVDILNTRQCIYMCVRVCVVNK